MDSISPLAKILAEANGIDWRSIQGSGADGSVVEQDILNYLSRVMSGDEEPPATPVDEAPPGWTGEMPPMPVNPSGLQALSAAGVESDITDFVAQQAQAVQAHVPEAQVTAPLSAFSGGTAAEPAPPVQVPPVSPSPVAPAWSAPAVPEITPAAQAQSMDAEVQPVPAPAAPEVSVEYAPTVDADVDDDLEFELDDADGETEGEDIVGDELELSDPEPVAATAYSEPAHVAPLTAYDPAPAYDPSPVDPEDSFLRADDLAVEEEAQPTVPATQEPAPTYAWTAQPAAQAEPAYTEPAHSEPVFAQPAVQESVAAAPVAAQFSTPEPVTETPVQLPTPEVAPAAQVAPAAPETPATGGGFGLGGFLSRLYGNRSSQPESVQPEPVQTEVVQPEPVTEPEPVFIPEPAVDEVAADSEPAVPEQVLGEAMAEQLPHVPDSPVAAPLVADQWREDVQAETSPEHTEAVADTADTDLRPLPTDEVIPEASTLLGHHHEVPQEAPPAHEVPQEASPAHAPESDSDTVSTPAAAGLAVAGLAAAGLGAAAAHHATEPAQAAAVQPEPVHTEPVHAETAQAEQTEPAAHSGPVVPAAAPAAALGQTSVLRLNVDVAALETARAQLSEALFREVPLSLLVARAAARSASTLGLDGPVALGTHAGQALAADLSGDFRASLDDLKRHSDAHAALLVLDAAELGLDELHRGDLSLSVGRTSTQGAALSLRGELDPARGAQFLHEVAGLLGTPIRLLF
ncbi:E3 binding domain-containing protein [Deinococcus aquiradiocola]|uniref:Peripheral subunit-binding (PSBD) domain-containing protein n=1 Tax=Deinococcus aquiradiocola TaxID=393059 RepID=A0A917PLH1_9DEIO|nr:E3 binding domain-containing protein [Deinococcus aquiradiocola]GGJ83306.1 hypothetical protein GCM10008939_28990 [Deinococcus aquiradiocola]